MKRFILPILLILVISSIVLVSCSEFGMETEELATKTEEATQETTGEGEGDNTTTTKKPGTTGTRPTWGTVPTTTTAAPTTKAPKPVFTKKDIQYKDPTDSGSTGSGSTGSGSTGGTTTPEDPQGNGNDLNLDEAPIPADPEKVVSSQEQGVVGGNEAPIIKNDVVNFLIKILG